MKEGTVPVLPFMVSALCDSDGVPVPGLSHGGSHNGGGEAPSERIDL